MKKLCLVIIVFSFIIPNLDWRIYLDMFPDIEQLAQCESGISAKAYNPNDTDGRPKYGLLQYGKWEFWLWSKQSGLGKLDIWNPLHQIVLYRWAEENGLSGRWGCWHKLVKSGVIINEL